VVSLELAVLAAVVLVGAGVAVLLEQTRNLHTKQEQMMADFSQFNDDLADLKQAVADAAARVEQKLDTLTDDSADQAAVDAAVASIREDVDALKAIAADDTPAPTEPTA